MEGFILDTNKKRKALISVIHVFVLASAILMTFIGDAYANMIHVSRVQQLNDTWCWAACSEMMSRVLSPNTIRTQTSIVTHVKGSPNTYAPANNSEVIAALNFACNTWTSSFILVPTYVGHQNIINTGKPLLGKINWIGTTDNHAVLINAYLNSLSAVHLVDPWYNCGYGYYVLSVLTSGINIQSGNNGKYVNAWIVQ
jgi:hypothetical protein